MRTAIHPGACRPLPASLSCALVLTMSSGSADAARIDYELGLTALYSDNLTLSPTAAESGTVIAPWLRFGAEQTGSAFALDLRGNLQYLDFPSGTFDDGFRGALSGQAQWTLIEERMVWVFEDYLSRQPVDTLGAFSLDNEQQTNVFVTGPSVFARFGPAMRGQLDLRYGNSRAEETDTFDSDRYNASLRLYREFSRTRRLGFNAEATRVDFDVDSAAVPDYTRYDAYLGYESEFRRLKHGLDAGYSQLEFRDGRGSTSAPLLRAHFDWNLAPRSTIDGRLSYQFADAAQDQVVLADDFQDAITDVVGNPQVPVTPDVFRERRVELGYRFGGERLSLQARPYYQRLRYVDAFAQAQDQRGYGGIFEIGYRVRPRLMLSFLVAHDTREFDALARKDRDFSTALSLTNAFTRHWYGSIGLQRRERSSTAAGQDYDENAATISIHYRR